MLFIIVSGLLVLTCTTTANAQTEECQNGLNSCLSQMTAAQSQGKSIAGVCQSLDVFLKCVFDTECGTNEAVQETIIEQTKADLKNQGLDCDANSADAEPEPSGSTAKPQYDISTCEGAGQKCMKDYMADFMKTAKANQNVEEKKWACPIYQSLADCLMDSPCSAAHARETLEQKFKESASGGCEIKFDSQKGNKIEDGENGASTLEWRATFIILPAAVLLAHFCMKLF